MGDMANIDLNFEPQSRPRSCTWPMKRPNLGNQEESDISMKLEPTIEEAGSQEQLMVDPMSTSVALSDLKQENRDNLMMSNAFPVTDFSNPMCSSTTLGCATDFTNILTPSQQTAITASDANNSNLSFINLKSLPQSNPVPVCNYGAASLQGTSQSISENNTNYLTESPAGCQQLNSASSSAGDATSTTSPPVPKPKSSSRKNAWGNMSYADLITQGIESSPDKRLTLAQIYDWMVKNVPYFKDKGDSNSSAGWKNSIRHNLSLHAKFKRIQNEGTGKSSWWVINHEAKPGKPNRRRTTSLDTSNPKFKQSRAKALGKKSELMLKKQKSCSKRESPSTWAKSGTAADGHTDFDHPSFNKSILSEFRPRTSSNASSIGGRLSPPRLLTQDLEDDGPPPLSPHSVSSFAGPSSALDPFGRNDAFSLGSEFDPMQRTGELLESINIDMTTSSPMTQCSNNDKTSIYLNSTQAGQVQNSYTCSSPLYMQQMARATTRTKSQQLPAAVDVSSNSNKGVLSSPNLASLLQQGNSNHKTKFQTHGNKSSQQQDKRLSGFDLNNSTPRARANTMPKLQPQPKYNMSNSMRRQQSGESLNQASLILASYPSPDSQQLPSSTDSPYLPYQYNSNPQPLQQQQRQQSQEGLSTITNQNKTLYQLLGQQRSNGTNVGQPQLSTNQQQNNTLPLSDQRNSVDGSLQMQNYAVQQQNGLSASSYSPLSDLNSIDNQDMFDPGTLDIEQMLQDIRAPENDELGMEFNSYFPQGSNNFEQTGMESTMDTNASALSPNNLSKIAENSPSVCYADSRLVSDSVYMHRPQPQPQQQQRYIQPFNMYNVSEGRGTELIVGTNTPSSASMFISRPGPSTLPSHFNRPHQMVPSQSSVGAISDYRM